MTSKEKQKAIDALKTSAPVIAVTQEEFNDYIQTLNKIMDWLEQEPCDDAISRQAVLDMMQMRVSGKELYKAVYESPPVNPQPKWISVSERLPEPYQNILVTAEDFHFANEPVRYSVYQESFSGNVDFIAWMPLPAPYEPQERNEE